MENLARYARKAALAVDKLGLTASCVCLIAITVLTTWSVVQRYLVSQPIAWNIALIESHLMLGFVCFALAAATRSREHVTIDSIYSTFGERGRSWIDAIADIVSLTVAVLFLWAHSAKVQTSWRTQSTPPVGGSELTLPDWTSDIIVLVGFLAMVIVLTIRFATTVVKALNGRAGRSS